MSMVEKWARLRYDRPEYMAMLIGLACVAATVPVIAREIKCRENAENVHSQAVQLLGVQHG
ncbi:hypothetical protein [Kibdelosporangium philippinense]|uniref:hypothetical protein n=1 Tax=Kibdelosporangium philippinense TaxID=211113 RepID=UPI0036140069